VFVIMNFRVSIKQVLARIRVAEKKKDLKVVIPFKKELLPFLVVLRGEGRISKFAVQQKKITLCLKKTKEAPRQLKGQKVLRGFAVSAALYRNPAILIFLSTTYGIRTNSSFSVPKIGGNLLFITY
jgi:ribosomal protein S8